MANEIGTVRVVLDGFAGAPGLIALRFSGGAPGVFTSSDATAALAAVETWLTAVKVAFSTLCVMSPQPDVEVIDYTSGALVSVQPGTGVAPCLLYTSPSPRD